MRLESRFLVILLKLRRQARSNTKVKGSQKKKVKLFIQVHGN